MGKNKIKKRVLLQKQFAVSFVWILILSIITTISSIIMFYFIYHQIEGFDSDGSKNISVAKIMEYTHNNGSLILKENHLNELKKIIYEDFTGYYIKDMDNNILYHSEMEGQGKNSNNFLKNLVYELRHNLHNTSSFNIPIVDKDTAKISRMLVLTYRNRSSSILLSFVDFSMPFICFITFTFMFARRLSRKMLSPINELMTAVEKIKNRDLNFSIKNNEDNEIGDLSKALEGMRSELEGSLIREWQLEQDRREMVAAITHDIRTPLAIIQGHVEGLQSGLKYDNEKLNTYLYIIEQNIFRVKKQIYEMNELTEIDSVDFLLYPSYIDLIEFMKNKRDELKVLASKKEIGIDMEIIEHRKENIPVSLDLSRLSQIIDNIVGNSIGFTPNNGTIKIEVEIKETRASFRISDTGPGFREKELPNTFKKFYKGDVSRSLRKGHLGLGLYITKSIVEKHGGSIKASNMPKGGGCIEFFITF